MQECPSCHKPTLSFCLRSGNWSCLSERPKCNYSETDKARRYRHLGFVGIQDVASCRSRAWGPWDAKYGFPVVLRWSPDTPVRGIRPASWWMMSFFGEPIYAAPTEPSEEMLQQIVTAALDKLTAPE